MKQKKLTPFILIFVVSSVVAGGLFLPGFFLNHSVEGLSGHMINIPSEYYASTGSASSTVASMQLTEYEKIRLISGAWDSESTLMDSSSIEKDDAFTMIEKAKEGLKLLYQKDLYPTSFSKTGSTWYTWDAKCYRSTDSTFHTYSAYYWLITLTKFDRTETHTILMTEKGTILYANAITQRDSKYLSDISIKYKRLPFVENALCSYTALSTDTVLPTYPDIEISKDLYSIGVLTIGNEWINDEATLKKYYNMSADSLEFYYMFQEDRLEKGIMHYTYGMIPYEGDSNGRE